MTRFWLALALTLPMRALAADNWLPISADELNMTSAPEAPGAPAVVLYRQVDRDDNHALEIDYIRIKILGEEGLKYANVRFVFRSTIETLSDIQGRTIHPDGSVYDFDGSVQEESAGSVRGARLSAKVFALPNVTVGSIIEYRWRTTGQFDWVYNSHWILSGPLFTRHAKFSLHVADRLSLRYSWPMGLPPATVPPVEAHRVVTLETRDVPAFITEDFMPPADEIVPRVDFVYSKDPDPITDPVAFWKRFGKAQFVHAQSFVDHAGAMKEALATIVLPTDTAEVKLRKIYTRVQQLHNDSYEPRTPDEALRWKLIEQSNDVADIWAHQHGRGWQITWLFLGLARAAGFQADPVWLSQRDKYFFNRALMNEAQLDSNAVLVKLDGKDMYADPGAAFTPFGLMPWWETGVQGLRLDNNGGEWIASPLPAASASRLERRATLQLTTSGTLQGIVTISYSGLEMQSLRLQERNQDDTARREFLEDQLKAAISAASEVTLKNHPDWEGSDGDLVAEFELKVPGWATAAGQRELMTAGLFAAREQKAFLHTSRLQPVYFQFPYQHRDDVTITLPSNWHVDALPATRSANFDTAEYHFAADASDGVLHLRRDLSSDMILLQTKFYPQLQEFYQSVRSGDAEQVILSHAPAAASR